MKSRSIRNRLVGLAAALLGVSLPARAGVLVVDAAGGPGAGFNTIQQAVNAAGEGDTVLVRSGAYFQFAIQSKSLSIVADGEGVLVSAGSISNGPGIWVIGLSRDQEVLVRGFEVESGVFVRDCEGAVWFDDVFVSGDSFCGTGGDPGARVKGSERVTFTRCFLRGVSHSDMWLVPHLSAAGVDAITSTVHLLDCTLQGGWGQDAYVFPLPGGAGLRVEASTVTVAGCTIQGGEGGVLTTALCTGLHAPGGPGVEFVGSAGVVRSLESTAVGGVQSLEPMCPGQTGPQGPAIAGTGTIVALPGFARHLAANGPVRGGETLAFEVQGRPGEVPALLVSLVHEPLPLLNAALLVGLPPAEAFVLSPLPASGQASLAFPVPNVGPAVGSLRFYVQAAFLDSAPAVWLGSAATVVLLDSSL